MRPGYYVDARFYSPAHRNQAVARAKHLAAEYGRDVDVSVVDHTLRHTHHYTAKASFFGSTIHLLRGAL